MLLRDVHVQDLANGFDLERRSSMQLPLLRITFLLIYPIYYDASLNGSFDRFVTPMPSCFGYIVTTMLLPSPDLPVATW